LHDESPCRTHKRRVLAACGIVNGHRVIGSVARLKCALAADCRFGRSVVATLPSNIKRKPSTPIETTTSTGAGYQVAAFFIDEAASFTFSEWCYET